MANPFPSPSSQDQPFPARAVLILALVYFLDEFLNYFGISMVAWVWVDIAWNGSICLAIFTIKPIWTGVRDDLRFPTSRLLPMAWTGLSIVFGIFLLNPFADAIDQFLDYKYRGVLPDISNLTAFIPHIMLNVLLTAFAEEFVFRSVLRRALERTFHDRRFPIFAISSFVFGISHWLHGPGGIVALILIGAVLMMLVYHTRSLWPSIASHYFMGLFATL